MTRNSILSELVESKEYLFDHFLFFEFHIGLNQEDGEGAG